jgi:hypothetical protein
VRRYLVARRPVARVVAAAPMPYIDIGNKMAATSQEESIKFRWRSWRLTDLPCAKQGPLRRAAEEDDF